MQSVVACEQPSVARSAEEPRGREENLREPSAHVWMDGLVRDCQVLAGRMLDADDAKLWELLACALASVPATKRPLEQSLARNLLTQVLGRVLRHTGLEGDQRVIGALVSVVSAATFDAWLASVRQCIRLCTGLLSVPNSDCSDRADVHVQQFLQYIDRSYAASGCSVVRLATALRLSPDYVTRLLKRVTGWGFAVHLRRRRVAAAYEMMRTTRLSIKEIAGAIGYESTRQFERDVKQLRGVTPSILRRQAGDRQ